MNGEEYMTARDVQRYLKISSNTLYRLRQDGLPFIKFEKKVLYRRRDIDAFMESRKVVASSSKPRK